MMFTRSTLPRWWLAGALYLAIGATARAAEPVTIGGLKNPESVTVGPGGKVYVTMIGDRDVDGDGSVVVVDTAGKITPFSEGLDDPKGMVAIGDVLFVADKVKVWRIDASGKAEVHVGPEAFPRKPLNLNDIARDLRGGLFVSEMGDRMGKKGGVYRIDPARKVTMVLDAELTSPPLDIPNGVLADDPDHLFVADWGSGFLYRYDLVTSTAERFAGGFGGTDGLVKDARGRLFVSDWKNGKLFVLDSFLQPPRLISDKYQSAADISITPDGKYILVPDMKAGTLTWLPMP